MVIWYIIGYFLFGIIVDILARVFDSLNFNSDNNNYSLFATDDREYFFIFIAWPLALVCFIVVTIQFLVTLLSEYIAKKIKERRSHEQAED